MQLKGVFKRIIPFFLTFALGLLVASFFVSVSAPNFGKFKRKNCRQVYRENFRLRMENERLAERIRRLEEERFSRIERERTIEDLKFSPNLLEPVPPPDAPRRAR
jgi:hypothetical protein